MKRTRNRDDIALRRKEIVDACEKLYREQDYHDINFKSIASGTSLSRPSLYNYFRTKEEVFLALLGRKFLEFEKDMEGCFSDKSVGRERLVSMLADVYFRHLDLMELMSVHLTDIETHCSLEELTEFKKIFALFLEKTKGQLLRYDPDLTDEKIEFFQKTLVALFFGMYPVIHPTPMQAEAMRKANVNLSSRPREDIEKAMELLLKALD